jgi:predicted RNase H-like HicB family nuclease
MKRVKSYQSVVYKEGKYYVGQCLNVDVSSFGSTEKEALCNLNEALALYLEDGPNKVSTNIEQPSIHTLHPQNA